MGSSCSHTTLITSNEDARIYNDKTGIWRFKVGDGKCSDCGKSFRVRKKICVEHGIEQPWEEIEPIYCKHDVVRIRQDGIDRIRGVYVGWVKCVACTINGPAFAKFERKNVNGQMMDVQSSEWDVDRVKINKENKNK